MIVSHVVTMLVAFILGMFIAATYHFSKRGFSHSQAYIKNLVMLTVVTCVVMLVIRDNIARAFTLVGALSIIRFRTPLKDPLDIGFVFYALAIGMAVCILILIWIQDEMSYDRFHENADSLYRVVEHQTYSGARLFPVAVTPAPLAEALKRS